MRKISKRGQIGQTITWFAATLIIFFISLIFIGASSFFASKKIVSLDNNEIIQEKLDKQSFKELQLILNTKVDNEDLNYLIKKWVIGDKEGNSEETENKIKESVFNILNKYEDCRIFEVYYGEKINNFEDFSNKRKIVVSNLDLNPESEFGRLQRVSETILSVNNESIRTKIYIGEC